MDKFRSSFSSLAIKPKKKKDIVIPALRFLVHPFETVSTEDFHV
jgi:hypothetical protein